MRMIDDHTGIEDVTIDDCYELLSCYKLGRLAMMTDGPVIFPINYVLDGSSIVFRTDDGSIRRAGLARQTVAFELDMADLKKGIGWSVLVRGELHEIADDIEIERLAQLDLHPWAPGKSHWMRIEAREVTGRRIVHVAPENFFG